MNMIYGSTYYIFFIISVQYTASNLWYMSLMLCQLRKIIGVLNNGSAHCSGESRSPL